MTENLKTHPGEKTTPEESVVSESETDTVDEATPQQTFADFNVDEDIVLSLTEAGIHHPFPIQAMTLPIALSGSDIIGQAKTGTGKTLGFGIPVLQHVYSPQQSSTGQAKQRETPTAPEALIVVPTRELAVQVANDLQVASRHRGTRIAAIYGGRAFEPQIAALRKGIEVVVGTPGRLIDLYRQKHLVLNQIRVVVLDEADEMLDLGFLPDVETLLSAVPAQRQTMLFSATMPAPVITMARNYMRQPTHIRASDPSDEGATKKDIRQLVYRAHSLDKPEVISRILQATGRGRSIIFTKTKRAAAKLAEDLDERGFSAAAIHGDLGQSAREQALRAFRNNKVDVLVATDVAARGIDIDDVTHVVNYQCPEDEKTYLHRVGRTGRAGATGTAVTFVDWEDVPRWSLIAKALGLNPEPVETYSSSPHLYSDLDIPEGTKGRLPKNRRVREGLAAEEAEDLGEAQRTKNPRNRRRRTSSQGHSPHKKSSHTKASSASGAVEDKARQTSSQQSDATQDRPQRTRTRRRTRR